jgi:hypothetical protein
VTALNGAGAVYAADLNNDDTLEVLGAAWYANTIGYWGNISGIITNTYDYAHSVFAIDMDDDGDIDVLGSALNADDITWWESDFVGIEEYKNSLIKDPSLGPTIVSGQLALPEGCDYALYDISGRQVPLHYAKPGIYFIRTDGNTVRKIVRIK